MAMKLERGRISGGVWEAVLTGVEAAPPVEVRHGGQVVEGVTASPAPGQPGAFVIRVPIPTRALNDGVQTFLVLSGAATLGSFTLIAGVVPEADIRAELDLLRAELDLLKRAFQRHARETG
ncbi:hypothetical protein [Rhodobacter calidifons]|uniref:Uncharacterized protein n=1 Tax=Rhodobacter calidifons TaxID=2715277 RepID=A0ABX0G5A0_9RHOB|nr:hypothetical protein [Rhodobacter calidifons]NHB76376.1 hypothetical protein [Rhodobacter calidifons]